MNPAQGKVKERSNGRDHADRRLHTHALRLRSGTQHKRSARRREARGLRIVLDCLGCTFEAADENLPGLNDEELTAKVHENVHGLLRGSDAEQITERCWDLLGLASSRELTRLLAVQATSPQSADR